MLRDTLNISLASSNLSKHRSTKDTIETMPKRQRVTAVASNQRKIQRITPTRSINPSTNQVKKVRKPSNSFIRYPRLTPNTIIKMLYSNLNKVPNTRNGTKNQKPTYHKMATKRAFLGLMISALKDGLVISMEDPPQ